jgi:LuxR family maltose regulon positive regulatory protein
VRSPRSALPSATAGTVPTRRSLELLGSRTVLASGPAVLESKLVIPPAGAVSRTALVNRLRALATTPVVSIVAPAGYGKTTLCAQWARRDGRPAAWLTVDDRDNDPAVLLRHLSAATERVDGPLLLVIDDAHLLRSGDAADALTAVALEPGSTLVLAGRRAPNIPLARLRAAGTVVELDAADLAFSLRESALLLRSVGPGGDADQFAELRRRSEGWPAGLALLARGGDRFVADYFQSEVASSLTDSELTFARRAAVLDRLSGPLCDAVLDARASSRRLRALDHAGAFIVTVGGDRRWYRFHGLFRDFLLAQLEGEELDAVPERHRRAADWFEAKGMYEPAVASAAAAGDSDRVAELVAAAAIPATNAGQFETVAAWFDGLVEADALDRHAPVAALAAWASAARGRGREAERLLAVAERGRRRDALPDGTPLSVLVGTVHAVFCREGAEQMLVDADAALAALPAESRLRASCLALRGLALMLAGHAEADAVFADAAAIAGQLGIPDVHALALSERSLLARDDHAAAEALAAEALAVIEEGCNESYPLSALTYAASARALLRHGRWDHARAQLALALDLVPQLTEILPWAAVQTRLELAHAFLALRDDAAAKSLLDDARRVLKQRPGLGVLAAEADALARELATIHHDAGDRGQGLTTAELRLLPMLSTHMSFREIGDRLFVSRNTIKTQAISVYRKLGVSTRSAAVERAQHLGLIETAVVGEFHPDRTT